MCQAEIKFMKTILQIKYDKNTPDIVKVIEKIKDLIKGIKSSYKIYENKNMIEVKQQGIDN